MINFKRILSTALLCAAAVSSAPAQDFALSAGMWSFFRNRDGNYASRSPGAFPSVGLTAGVTPRIEAGLSLVPRITPRPLDDIFVEGHLGFSLFGDRIAVSGGPSAYLNTVVDIGTLVGVHNVLSGNPGMSTSVFLRLTPFLLGNPYYGRRDRMYSAGILYDVNTGAVSLFANVFASDFFLARRPAGVPKSR